MGEMPISSTTNREIINTTGQVAAAVASSGDAKCLEKDILHSLSNLVPKDGKFEHQDSTEPSRKGRKVFVQVFGK